MKANHGIFVRAWTGAAEASLHPSSLKMAPVQAWFGDTGQFIILEYPKQRAQVWHAATGLPVTPSFQSRYATNETDCRTVRLSTGTLDRGPQTTDHRPSAFALRAPADKPTTDFGPPSSVLCPPTSQPPASSFQLRALAELLSGSLLDGTGGWKPLELAEIVERWNEFNRAQPYFANQLRRFKRHEESEN